MTAIFDASVVVKWFVRDPLTPAAQQARAQWPRPAAPSILTVEVANAFRRYVIKGDLDADLAIRSLDVITRVIRTADHRPMLEDAFLMACRKNHSMQDCVYGVMAVREGLPLVTADKKMANKLSDVEGLDLRLIA